MRHSERHRTDRIGWLRAAVLGANDGLVSTASLMVGIAATQATSASVLLSGIAGLTAGALSMAAGEYVSVHSQADAEQADLAREKNEITAHPVAEHQELTSIYVARGLDPALAEQVAEQLMRHDALGAHARDELGIFDALNTRPLQAALASAASFAVGAMIPLVIPVLGPQRGLIYWIFALSLCALAGLGFVAAKAGGARVAPGMWRVTLWGAIAMAVTAGVGHVFGVSLS
ncbi:MAG TPA: VIT family protein [Rhodanobacter sp.]